MTNRSKVNTSITCWCLYKVRPASLHLFPRVSRTCQIGTTKSVASHRSPRFHFRISRELYPTNFTIDHETKIQSEYEKCMNDNFTPLNRNHSMHLLSRNCHFHRCRCSIGNIWKSFKLLCVSLTKCLRLSVRVHWIDVRIERDFYLVTCINWTMSAFRSVGYLHDLLWMRCCRTRSFQSFTSVRQKSVRSTSLN